MYHPFFCNGFNSENLKLHLKLTNYIDRILPEKLTSSQLMKIFPTFYGTRRFIATLTSACHLSLFWARSVLSIPPHPTSWKSILIIHSHLCLVLPRSLIRSLEEGATTNATRCRRHHRWLHAWCRAQFVLIFYLRRCKSTICVVIKLWCYAPPECWSRITAIHGFVFVVENLWMCKRWEVVRGCDCCVKNVYENV
jgi:hypothetical protein